MNDHPRATKLTVLAGLLWLACAASIGYLAYQQWTVSQTYVAAGLDIGALAILAALNVFACAVTLFFAAGVLFRPARTVLISSVVWAALVIVGAVAQVRSPVEPVFAAITATAIVAGVLSYVGRLAFTPHPDDESAPVGASMPAAAVPTASPPPLPVPAAPVPAPAAATSPPPVAAALRSRTAAPAPAVAPPRPFALGDTPSVTASAVRSERTSPVLILFALLTAVLAIGAIAYVLASGFGSSLIGGLSPTPTPIATPVPTPSPTPTLAAAGPIVFGLTYDPDTFQIPEPRDRFKATNRSIAWSATVPTPLAATPIAMTVSSRPSSGAETTLQTQTFAVSGLKGNLIAADSNLAALAGNAPGTYVLRLTQGDRVLAEGTFTLVK